MGRTRPVALGLLRHDTDVPRDAPGCFAAVHESESGPTRHFATTRHFGRFRSEADISW